MKRIKMTDPIPVTMLSGFLGSGTQPFAAVIAEAEKK